MSAHNLDGVSAIGAGRVLPVPVGGTTYTVEGVLNSTTTTKLSAATLLLEGALRLEKDEVADYNVTGMSSAAGLAAGSTTDRFATSLMSYNLRGTSYTLAAEAAGHEFSANHVITASKFGAIQILIDSSGAISSKVPGATQTTAMAYDDAPTALVAAKALALDSDKCLVGYILIENDGSTWTANTDDLVAASDVTTIAFLDDLSPFYTLGGEDFTATEITNQKSMYHVISKGVRYVRLNLTTLTGTGTVDGYLKSISEV